MENTSHCASTNLQVNALLRVVQPQGFDFVQFLSIIRISHLMMENYVKIEKHKENFDQMQMSVDT